MSGAPGKGADRRNSSTQGGRIQSTGFMERNADGGSGSGGGEAGQ